MWGNEKAERWWWCEISVSHLHIADTNIHTSTHTLRVEPKQWGNREDRREEKQWKCDTGLWRITEKRTIGKYLCMLCRLGACSNTFEFTAYKSTLLGTVFVCVCVSYIRIIFGTVEIGNFFSAMSQKYRIAPSSSSSSYTLVWCIYIVKWRMTCTHANSKWKWILNIYDYGYNFYELNGKAITAISAAAEAVVVVVSTATVAATAANRKCMTV